MTGIVEDGVDCVFFPAALTWVDRCEAEPAEAMRVNRDAPAAAARAAAKQGAPLVFYSTEYVFDGERGDYDEDSTPSPTSVYGRSKLEGERAVLDGEPARGRGADDAWSTVPIRRRRTSSHQLRRRLAAGEGMRVPVDQVRARPTTRISRRRASSWWSASCPACSTSSGRR